MKKLVFAVLLLLTNPLIAAECDSEMSTLGLYQIINKGMLDLTLAGKMNKAVGDDIGARSKKAQALSNKGEYQAACDVYQEIISEYGFKSFEESYYEAHPEKRPGAEKPKPASASASSSAEAAAVSASEAEDATNKPD